jgi:hypothetical protein
MFAIFISHGFVKYKKCSLVHKIPRVFKDHVKFVLRINIAQIL